MAREGYWKDYYQKNKEKIIKKANEWNENNVKRRRTIALKWYHANKQIKYEKRNPLPKLPQII